MNISVVIPALNEEGNIGNLVRETFGIVPEDMLAEIIVIDDFSNDGTHEEVTDLLSEFPKLRYMRHGARSGQSAAMRTGIQAARAPVIVTMDGDGQNDPADIEGLVERLGSPGSVGPALVGGVREKRRAAGSRRWASIIANRIRDGILRDDCPDTGCGIKAYWRDAFLRLPFFTSMHRYLPALFQTYGHTVAYMPVNDRPRRAGISKYTNLGRALIGIYDLFGVTWLRRRTIVPDIVDDRGVDRPIAEIAELHTGRMMRKTGSDDKK